MGTLYLVGTPIGNLEDITLRALRVLKEVSLIAAEDTRRAGVLLKNYDISTPTLSYFEGNKEARVERLLTALAHGDVALISEAGMPNLSDPGYELVAAGLEHGHQIVPIPGPSAPITALIASGLPTDRFLYLGFLPRRRSSRQALLKRVAQEPGCLIAFEAPHRIRDTLADLEDALGNRPIALCREMTKRFEEIWRGNISEARAHYAQKSPRGEFTLVIGGAAEGGRWSEEKVRRAVSEQLGQGLSRPQAAREIAQISGWSRRKIYDLSLQEDNGD